MIKTIQSLTERMTWRNIDKKDITWNVWYSNGKTKSLQDLSDITEITGISRKETFLKEVDYINLVVNGAVVVTLAKTSLEKLADELYKY